MTIERAIRIMAGAFILISLALGVDASPIFVSKYFLWVTVFVGALLAIFDPANRSSTVATTQSAPSATGQIASSS